MTEAYEAENRKDMEGVEERAKLLLQGVILQRSEWGKNKKKDLEILTKWLHWHEEKIRNKCIEAMKEVTDWDKPLN